MTSKPVLAAAFAALLAISTLGAAVSPSLAQTPLPMDEDPLSDRSKRRLDKMEKVVRELRSIVFQGRDTGKPVVVQPTETEAVIQTLTQRVDDLEQTLTRLNGQNEALTQELNEAKRDAAAAKASSAALAERLAAAEQRLTEAPPPPPGQAATADENPDAAFQQARDLLLGGDYDGAEAAFAAFVERHGDSEKAPEARYWWGETLSVRQAYADAAAAYIGAIRGWPKTGWAPDATVKLARSLIAIKRPADACKTLDEFAKRYPTASAAVVGRATAARAQAKCG